MKIRFTVLALATFFTTINLMATTQNVVKASSIFGPDLVEPFPEVEDPPSPNLAPIVQPSPNLAPIVQPSPDTAPIVQPPPNPTPIVQPPPNPTPIVQPPPNPTPIVQPPPNPTPAVTQAEFSCISQGNSYATVVRKAEGETVLITWNSRSFGPRYTPQERCNQVTGRLQNYVSANGNDISNLLLTTGYVNGLPVICVVNSGQLGCNSSNVLFTLSQQNAADPGRTLAQFLNLSHGNISGNPIQERQGKSVVPLDIAVDSSFSSPRSILESGGLNIANCRDATSSLIVFDNSKLCVQAKRPLKPRKRYYYNSSTGQINKQRI